MKPGTKANSTKPTASPGRRSYVFNNTYHPFKHYVVHCVLSKGVQSEMELLLHKRQNDKTPFSAFSIIHS